jgi:hypothetical protein
MTPATKLANRARRARQRSPTMIDYREDGDLIEITVDGRITRQEFDAVAARLEAQIRRHGRVRVLEQVKSFGGMDPATFWADVKFGLRHLNDFSRCAVVSDKRWISALATGVGKLVACEIRHFAPDEIAAARAWLDAPGGPAPVPG